MKLAFTLDQLEGLLPGAEREGEVSLPLTGVASLEEAREGELSFLSNPKYRKQVPSCVASVILVPTDYADSEPRAGQAFLRVPDPSRALAELCARVQQMLFPRPEAGIDPRAVVDSSARVDASAAVGPCAVIEAGAEVGSGCIIGAGSFVGRGAVLGPDCELLPRVVVGAHCRLGARVRLHSGVVLGSDGFGYLQLEGKHVKVPQVGSVVVEDDVEIGANTAIDRARFGETRIGKGTKIDNLVQVAHNVVMGENCILVSQTGISGSTKIGDRVVFWGQSAAVGHVQVGDDSFVGGRAAVSKDLPSGSRVRGAPAYDFTQCLRDEALVRRLPQLVARVKELEAKVKELESGAK